MNALQKDTPLSTSHDTSPDRLYFEVQDYFDQVSEGHLSPENGLARVIEHIAKANPKFLLHSLDNAGVSIPCRCLDWD